MTEKYGKDKCLGTRQILSEVEEIQPNGRSFQKFELGDYHWRSFSDLEVEADKLSKGLYSLGLKEGDRGMCIIRGHYAIELAEVV